jgi:hypothetical protein
MHHENEDDHRDDQQAGGSNQLQDEREEHELNAQAAAEQAEKPDGTVDETDIAADEVADRDEHSTVEKFER